MGIKVMFLMSIKISKVVWTVSLKVKVIWLEIGQFDVHGVLL